MGKRIFDKVKLVLSTFMDIIFPEALLCSSCGRIIHEENENYLCKICENELNFQMREKKYFNLKSLIKNNETMKNIDIDNIKVFVPFYYKGKAREIVHRLKYKDKIILSKIMAIYMAKVIEDENVEFDYIIPVPLHKNRYLTRGYNQAELIARELAIMTETMCCDFLERNIDTVPQRRLGSEERWSNLQSVFSLKRDCKGMKILIVDDVITTGATICSCLKAFEKCGVEDISICTFAATKL